MSMIGIIKFQLTDATFTETYDETEISTLNALHFWLKTDETSAALFKDRTFTCENWFVDRYIANAPD